MPGQIVKIEGDALGYHLREGRGWSEGYIIILNLAIIHKVFQTRAEAQEYADDIPDGWEPQLCVSVEPFPE
ncbi:hypothetical protein [Pseudomonas sp. UBA6323]|uniref:hypothetical protein n=1 Tax=Pseudomonas sp. UBA6323 TaxID=1947329 RepID=UPI0025DA51E1|nr:hypothetical protein [Pseudomonas sp. UBA6323]